MEQWEQNCADWIERASKAWLAGHFEAANAAANIAKAISEVRKTKNIVAGYRRR